jgi:hypothetical protein
MEKTLIIHIVVEIILVGIVVLILWKKIKNVNTEVEQIRSETNTVIEFVKKSQTNNNTKLSQMSSDISSIKQMMTNNTSTETRSSYPQPKQVRFSDGGEKEMFSRSHSRIVDHESNNNRMSKVESKVQSKPMSMSQIAEEMKNNRI